MPHCLNCGKFYHRANRHELPSGKYNCGTRRHIFVDGYKILMFASVEAIVKSLVPGVGPHAYSARKYLFNSTFKSARKHELACISERKKAERRRRPSIVTPPPIPKDAPYRRCITCKERISLPTDSQCLRCFSDSLLCL